MKKTFSVEYSLQCVMLRKVCSPWKGVLAICEREHLVLKTVLGGRGISFLREAEETKYWRERNLHCFVNSQKRVHNKIMKAATFWSHSQWRFVNCFETCLLLCYASYRNNGLFPKVQKLQINHKQASMGPSGQLQNPKLVAWFCALSVQKACKVSQSEKPNESEEFNNVQHMALKT